MEGARELPKVILRVPVELKERIQQRAKNSLRSMNSEILSRLNRSLDDEDAAQSKQK